MATPKDTWTAAHDLALVYLALAYGADRDLRDEELSVITERLASWNSRGEEEVQEIVMEALAVYLEEDASDEVAGAVRSLAEGMSEMERRQALEDVVRIAEADGILLSSERSLIATLAEAWGVKATEQHLLDQTTATVEDRPAWSLLHDLSLVFLALAHGADNELSDPEIAAMIDRLQEWEPDLTEEDARTVLRGALEYYAGEPGEEALHASVAAIKEALPAIQRLVVLGDLRTIANADGTYDENERAMIASLAKAWDTPVRTGGAAEA